MGEPMANYKAVIGAVRRLTDPTPDGLGMSARGITVSTVGLVPADQPAGRRGHPGHPGAEPARARRRAAQRAGPDQHPLVGRRDRRGGVELRADDQAPGLDRVRHDARHQRPGLARRPAGRRAQLLRRLGLGARQPDPAQPHAGLEVDRQRPARTSASSSAASRRRASRPRCATPAAARSTAPAASWPPRSRANLSDVADPNPARWYRFSCAHLRRRVRNVSPSAGPAGRTLRACSPRPVGRLEVDRGGVLVETQTTS